MVAIRIVTYADIVVRTFWKVTVITKIIFGLFKGHTCFPLCSLVLFNCL